MEADFKHGAAMCQSIFLVLPKYLARQRFGMDNSGMALLRSARALAVIVIFAMMLAVFAPFSTATGMMGHASHGFATASLPSTMDCDMCPKAMALGGCIQTSCQVAATATEHIHPIVTKPISYPPVAIIQPAEWHTVPPISPG